MIRHYEKIGLIAPAPRRSSGYSDYDDRDVPALRFIGRARDLCFGIDEIGQLLALWNVRFRPIADITRGCEAASVRGKERTANNGMAIWVLGGGIVEAALNFGDNRGFGRDGEYSH